LTTEEFLQAAVEFVIGQGLPRPRTIRLDLEDGQKFRLPVPPPGRIPARKAEEPEDEDREDTDVATAIMDLIHDSTSRLTGGQIQDKLATDDRRGFGKKNIGLTLTRLTKGGRLSNHVTDPQDGHGRGYGLPEWDG
jgi:hypothetical protein